MYSVISPADWGLPRSPDKLPRLQARAFSC